MVIASGLFGALLIAISIVLQRWSIVSWDDQSSAQSQTFLEPANRPNSFAQRQFVRRTWTNILIGTIGGIMIVSSQLPKGTWWLISWALIALLLVTITLMAIIDFTFTWMHYKKTLSQIAEKSLGQTAKKHAESSALAEKLS
jgi:hypothetical protein